MFSLTLARYLVYGALALSLLCALATLAAVIWRTAHERTRRWPGATLVPIAASAIAAWFWLHPSFVAGSLLGAELGRGIGQFLSPTADATMMSIGIGLGTYTLFTVPVALLARLVGLAVTTPGDPHRPHTRPARTSRIELWGQAIRAPWNHPAPAERP